MKTKALFVALATILAASAAFPANTKPLPNPDTDPPGFTIQKVGDGIYAAFGGDDDPAESNAGFVIGTTGVAVIDTFDDRSRWPIRIPPCGGFADLAGGAASDREREPGGQSWRSSRSNSSPEMTSARSASSIRARRAASASAPRVKTS
jgi:opacity protein-like surface antigen